VNDFWLALSFLTTIPTPQASLPRYGLGQAAKWSPLVGLIVGSILVVTHWLLTRMFPSPLNAALLIALWTAVTGGLHLDGLADCCDGLLVATTPQRRLEIMRDPRLGAFGGTGLILFLMLKLAAAAALPSYASFALLLSAVAARTMILIAARQPMARPEGLGASFAAGGSTGILPIVGITTLILSLWGGFRAFLALALTLVVTWSVIRLACKRLNGITGDVLGLIIELTELAILLFYTSDLRL
jgi:adenosylcobinamide-GDP ribazoletransferase